MKLSELTVDERGQLSDINLILCQIVIMEKEGKEMPQMDIYGAETSLEILKKLDLSELKLVEESIRYIVKGDQCRDDNEATEYYRKAFEVNPYNDIAIKSYGCLLAMQGRLAEGIQWVRKAIEVNPNNKRARSDLAAMEEDLKIGPEVAGQVESHWNTCSNPQFGFQFQYPRGWVNVQGIPSIIYHPPDAQSFLLSEGGKTRQVFSPALTLMMVPRGKTAGQTSAEVFEGFKRLLPSYFLDYESRSERTFQLPTGQEAMEITFDFLKAGHPFRAVLAYVIQPNFIFIFDGSSLRADFSAYEATLRQGIRSLHLQ
jgi:tetratricopeptide (TPR) repeat protein